jgi:cold shock CspA family protein
LQTVVKKWFRDKNYGFLRNGNGPDIIVWKNDLTNCQFLKPGVNVEFECHLDNGKLRAKNVKLMRAETDNFSQNRNTYRFGVMT